MKSDTMLKGPGKQTLQKGDIRAMPTGLRQTYM